MRSSIRKKLGKWLLLTLVLINTAFAASAPTSVAAESSGSLTDYEQQAIYIVRFGMSFVEWPTVILSEGIKNINICVVGNSPSIVKSLQNIQTAAAKKIKINIKEVETESLIGCNIAYIPKNKTNYKEIIANAKSLPVLTVSPIPGFAKNGGIVELSVSEIDASGAPVNSKAKVSLIINNGSSTQANLKISPELLESAEVIR